MAIIALSLSACSMLNTKVESPSSSASTKNTANMAIESTKAAEDTSSNANALLSAKSDILNHRLVHFEFDSYEIAPEYGVIIQAHADNLVKHPELKITLNGHCDETGPREYNISLGQKRAAAVAKMLELSGVSKSQIETISFGKEKPLTVGGGDEADALNRRAQVVYDGENADSIALSYEEKCTRENSNSEDDVVVTPINTSL